MGSIIRKGSVDFCKNLKKGYFVQPATTWEDTYYLAYKFKKEYKDETKENKILKLQHLASITLGKCKTPYEVKRERQYSVHNKKCFVCNENDAHYYHHIIPLKRNGNNDGMNRIPICDDCHKLIHPWLFDNYVPTPKPIERRVIIRRASAA